MSKAGRREEVSVGSLGQELPGQVLKIANGLRPGDEGQGQGGGGWAPSRAWEATVRTGGVFLSLMGNHGEGLSRKLP